MHRLLFVCFLALVLCGLPARQAGAQLTEALRHFDEGNRLYAAGAYADALAAYEQASASGYVSGALYHNMGNAYYRLDELGQAIRHYEKARRLIPNDPHLQHSLTIARSHIETPISSLPTPLWTAWWDRFVVRTGAFPFFIAGLVFYGLAAVLFGQRIWTGTRNSWHRRALSLSSVLGLLLLVTAFGASLNRPLNGQAVVIDAQASLREAPEHSAASEFTVPEGILLDVLDREETWLEVRLPNGTTGWLNAESVADV